MGLRKSVLLALLKIGFPIVLCFHEWPLAIICSLSSVVYVFSSAMDDLIGAFLMFLMKREYEYQLTVSELVRRRKRLFKRQCVRAISAQLIPAETYVLRPPRSRTLWKKMRSEHWWNVIVLQHFGESEWLENFRMRKDTFMYLCNELSSALTAAPCYVREPLSLEKRVAIALYKLASCAEYRVIANQFGVHKSSVPKCLYSFVETVNSALLAKLIKMPDTEEAERISNEFSSIIGFPRVIGAIDGTHIPVLAPQEGYSDFVNRKGWTSIVLQAVVDCHYCFRNINISHTGNIHDASVLKDSGLYKMANSLIPKAPCTINGTVVPKLLLGDAAYPLLPWLMKPYTGTLSPEQESFGVYLSSTRIVVENAFGRLKARWRCLAKSVDINYQFVPQVVASCCVLHNIIEKQKDNFNENWLNDVERSNTIFPQPSEYTCTESDQDAERIRESLKNYCASNYPLRRSRLRL